MNYTKHYDQLVYKAKLRNTLSENEYYETHHILPKCLGGSNKEDNLVRLTAREHFVAHWLLCRTYPEEPKLAWAFRMMCTIRTENQHRYIPSSRAYQEAKHLAIKATSDLLKGVPKSEDHKRKAGEGNRGKKRTQEVKTKLSLLKKGKPSGRAKGVYQLHLNGDVICWFTDTKEAEKATGVLSTGIQAVCNGRYKQSGGFLWRYGKEDENNREHVLETLNKALSVLSLEEIQTVKDFVSTLKAPPAISRNFKDGH